MATPHSSRKPARRQSGHHPGRLVLAWLGLGAIGAILVGAVVLLAAVAIALPSLPSYPELMKSPQGQSVVIRAADGTELVTVGPSYGRWIPYAEIPRTMVEAMKAVEDRRFDRHFGIDPVGMMRAAVANFRSGGRGQGASTITQQLARNLFLTRARTYGRKLREVVLALAMERKYSKQQIMEAYLNRVYFGGGAYGIDAASRKFYGHPATRLSAAEAAIIAGLVKAPSRYAPTADPERARARAETVLRTMQETGVIDPGDNLDVDGVHFVVDRRQGDVRYFTDWVLTQLDTLTDEPDEALEVTTSLNARQQAAAEAAAKTQEIGGTQLAILAMRTDGAVTAMVGGRDYATSIYNRAVTAERQPGSSWKLFDYLVALEGGLTPDSIVVDEPVTIGGWSPKNSNNRYMGAVTLRQAFALSINTVAAKLAQEFGQDTVARMARRFGITTPISTLPAMALGTSDVTLLQMTAAYAAVANNGIEVRPWAIQSVTTASGKTLYNREPPTPRVLVAPFIARSMTSLLHSVVESGTGRAAQIGRELAGKTGTTSSNKDGWFLGFTPDLVAGVWMGRDDARAVRGLAGGQAPARVFSTFMRQALAGTAATPLNDDVPDADVDAVEPDEGAYGLGGSADPFAGDSPAADPGALDPSLAPGAAPVGATSSAAATPGAPSVVAPPASSASPATAARPAPLSSEWLDGVIRHDSGDEAGSRPR